MKTRRALSLFLVVAMILSMFTMILPASAAPVGTHTRSRTVYTYYSDEQLMEMFHVDRDTLNKMSKDAYEAVMHNSEWNVASYGVQRKTVVADALFELIYRNPECFFVSGVTYYRSGETITRVLPTYETTYEEGMAQHQAMVEAAQEIMCLFQRTELTDLELAILIHDYLAANFEYHLPTLDLGSKDPGAKYSAYNLLVEGTAVCQGYAEAYAYLMMQFGINCGLCNSDVLNHAWSIVELDGEEYHVDVTWDDPTNDVEGYVEHVDFLVSTDKLKETHKADDLSGNPTDTKYDNAFWRDVTSAFCLLDSTIYYINSSGWLCSWTDEVTSTALYKIDGYWPAGDGYVWSGNFSRLATDGEKLFFTSPTAVYEYLPESNSVQEVYVPTLPVDNGIYGLSIEGNNIRVSYHTTPIYDDNTKAENTATFKYRDEAVANHVFGEAIVETAPTCEADGEARYDCIYCGFSKFETVPAAGHTEEPLTGKAATCTEDGLTDGTACSVCGETIQEQEPIPAPGHDWLNATCTEPAKCSVCGEVKKGDPAYVLVNSVDELKDGGQVVIVANVNGEYKALGTEIADKITPINVTVADDKVIGENLPVWTLAPSDDGYTLNNGSQFLAYNSSTNFEAGTSAYAWGMEPAGNGGFVMNSTETTRGIYYQHKGGKFGAYSTQNQNNSGYVSELFIFKYGEAAGSALGHTEEVIPGTPATCTEDGMTDGAVCSVCGEIIREQETINAPGHTEVTVPGKEATCTEDGLTDGIVCSVCGETIREQETIDAHGHTEKEVEGSDPTCTEDGKSAHTVCEVCGEALTEVETTPALGHDEVYTSSGNGTHTITCTRCNLEETTDCYYVNGVCEFCNYSEPASEGFFELATSIAVGDKVILVCKDAGMELSGISTTSTKYGVGTAYSETVQELYVLEVVSGNKEGTFAFLHEGKYLSWTSGNSLNTNETLSNNTSWTLTFDSDGNATIKNATTPARVIWWNNSSPRFACYTDKTADKNYFNIQFYKYVIAEEPGECRHPNKVVEEKAPTCVDPGYIKWSCPDCGANGEDPIAPNPENHIPGEVDETILLNATCTYEGIKDVIIYCNTCGEIISRNSETPIPMIPHDYGEDGICTYCYKDAPGKTFYLVSDPLDLESFVLYHPASGYALSLDPSGNKLKASKVTVENGVLITVEDTAVFTRIQPLDNEFPLRIVNYKSDILASGETKGNLLYTTEESTFGCWKPVVVSEEDRTFRFENLGSGLALQFYNDQFSAYTGDGDAYIFQIYNSKPVCDHQWDDGRQVKDPTCNEPGQVVYTCTVCGDFTVKFLPTTEHAWQVDTTEEPTCTEDGMIHYTCSNCGEPKEEPIPSKGHSMDDGAITTAPTCTEDGIKTFTCTACGLEKTEVVPATGHTMEDDTCTVCGYTKPVVKAGQYVIAANVNGTYYAMDNAFASKIAGTSITLTDGKIREDHAEGFVITLAESDGGWTIRNPDGSYLKYASGTNLGKSDTPYVWTFTEGTKGTWRVSSQDESRGLVFRTEDSSKEYKQFGGYAVSNITATGTQYYDIELIPVIPAPDAELTNRSISLNGNIAVNFYMSLSDKVVADPDAYMLFKQEGKIDENGNEITVKVPMAKCVQKQVRGRTSYVFTYEVAAKEMTDTITAQFFYGDTCTEEYTYSVKTYADNQRTNMADNDALMKLLDAMLNYGAASQLHFGYNIHRLANEGMEPVDYSGLSITGYDLPTEYGTDLVTFVGASLILKSETTLRFFFIVKDGTENFTISYNGTPLEIKSSSGLHYVDVEDISAQNLDLTYSVTVNDGVQEGTIPYSPLTYCQSVRSKDTTAEALANLCGALYLYNSAANSFFDEAE